MDKINFVHEDRELYTPPVDDFVEVEVPELGFLMIDGTGSPDGTVYAAAVQGLYSLSYAVKFASKKQGRDYGVCPLEGLWWSERMESFHDRSKDEWSWTMMIRQPGWVTAELVDAQRAKARVKAPEVDRVRLDRYAEGLSVQIMHIGPYSAEAPTIARLHDEYLPQHGLVETGHHHEIYIGDPRRSAPEKLKTILRQPVARTR